MSELVGLQQPVERVWLRSAIAGLLVAAALPPWGWWPLAFVGIASFAHTSAKAASTRQAFLTGFFFAMGWLAPGMAWMWFLSAPGYVIAVLLFATFHGVAEVVVYRHASRRYMQPLLHTMVEAMRFSWPFGGAPLASLAISQASSPLAPVARIGGAILLTWLTWQLGSFLANPRRLVLPLLALLLVVVAMAPTASTVQSESSDAVRVRVAYVQGGGPQGTRAVSTNPRDVMLRHLSATQTLNTSDRIDMVVWPENVVDVATFEKSRELKEIAIEAARLNAPILVGITEDAGPDNFTNAQVVVTPQGFVVDRYDKVRRVPFGEYMPLRSSLKALGAPVDLVPRDALAGTTPGVLRVPLSHPTVNGSTIAELVVATAISWEVFFGGRVNEGIELGAQLIVNPTNGSSYRGTILQSQQVASSRLRAIEMGRTVVQVSPTGFSAFISPDGAVGKRSSVSESAVRIADLELRQGRTWYSHLGDAPLIVFMLLAIALLLIRKRTSQRANIAGRPLTTSR